MRRPDGWAGHAVEVRDGVLKRVVVNTDGQLLLYPKNTAKDNYAFVVLTSAEEGGNGRAWIKRDGSAWFNGNVTVDGTIANVELDTKLASLNKDLSDAKELIAELRLQNEMLTEKVALLEMNISNPLIYETIKSAQEKNRKTNQLLGFIKK